MDMFEKLLNKVPADTRMVSNSLRDCIQRIKKNLEQFIFSFPSACSENGFYKPTDNDDWTNGFWTGLIWLASEITEDFNLCVAAMYQIDNFAKRLKKHVVLDHHDMGFLFIPSCVAGYKLIGDLGAKNSALQAADILMGRYQKKGEFIQAWGTLGDKEEYRFIVDSLLNVPLLFWAAEIKGDDTYLICAQKHIDTVIKYAIREDGSANHSFYFNPKTGEPLYGITHQGNRHQSAWSRGQAWVLYGTALAYGRFRDNQYLEAFEKSAVFFISHLPDDLIPYWDFDFNTGSSEPRDSSALAITICAFIEISQHTSADKGQKYLEAAKILMRALITECAAGKDQNTNGLLLHGTYARDSKENGCNNIGVDECNLWGDYYYMEALVRLSLKWNSYWL